MTVTVSVDVYTNSVHTKTVSGAALTWATVKLYCGSDEVTSANLPGLSISNGVITIPSSIPADEYRVYIGGTYECENGCRQAFSGYCPLTVE